MSWQQHGRSLLRCSHSFSRFGSVVDNYDKSDVGTKNAILDASSSVASLISRIGDKVVFIGSGTIIECEAHDESFFGTILTSATFLQGPVGEASIPPNLEIDVYLSGGKLYEAQVLTCDFCYNIATIKIKSDAPLSAAKMRYIDDTLAIDSNMSGAKLLHEDEEACSTRYNLYPGEPVIALARYSEEPHEIMAAPGLFSCDDVSHDCKELFSTTCPVTKAAVGGPVVNCYGEVIGVNFVICPFNTFLPINIALKCLEDLKKNRQVQRPWLGVDVANLYTANLEKLDELTRKFPHVTKGVVIEQVKNSRDSTCMKRTNVCHWTFWSARTGLKAKVILENIKKKRRIQTRGRKRKIKQESPASRAGLCSDDVIIRCDGKSIGSHLEFIEALWNKEGKPVELIVVRPTIGELKLIVTVGTNPKMNRWHVPLVGFLSTLEDRLAIERKRKVGEMA